MRSYLFNIFMGLFLTSSMVFGQSASDNRVGQKTDWSVFFESDPKECWAVAAPKQTVNTKDKRVVSVKRSDILLMVTYRPSKKVQGQVGFTGGYPFAKGSTVNLDIDGNKFELATADEWAWPSSQDADTKVVAAMKRGKMAVLSARSSRGTITKDTFSLLGFTAAVEDAAKRCGG